MSLTKKSGTQTHGKPILCTRKLPKLHSSTSENIAQIMCFKQFSFFIGLSFNLLVSCSQKY